MKNNKSIYNPYGFDIGALIDAAIKKHLQRVQTCIPAIVKEVKSREQVIVSPAVQQVNADWQSLPWADLVLPVYTPAGNGGKAVLSFPVKVGDIGWIIAGDLDPSLYFKDTTKPARQGIYDRHKYQFGFFMPAKINNLGIDQNDDGGIVIKNGDTKIVIKENEIDIESNNTLKINAKSVNITSENNSIEIDGVDWKNHTHSVGSLSVPVTAAEGAISTITGDTGGVN